MRSRTEAFLEERDLSEVQFWILHTVAFEERPMKGFFGWVAGFQEALALTHASRKQYNAAYHDLIERGLIQVVNEDTRDYIRLILERDKAIGPLCGLPSTGIVDFTMAGAELWRALNRKCSGCDWPICWHSDYYAPRRCALYGTDINALLDDIPFEFYSAAAPEPIGPWRGRWWQRFESGFRLDIHYHDED